MNCKTIIHFLLIFTAAAFFTGCLSVGEKEYHFNINADGSGSGKILYLNIVSEEDEEVDKSFDDFGELISDYVDGNQFEEENPHLTVTGKTLYVEDGKLNGRVEFTFENADSVGFFINRSCDCSPAMYYVGSLSETLIETNGRYLGESGNDMPIIIWDSNSGEYFLKTVVKEDMSDAHELLPLYNIWKESR